MSRLLWKSWILWNCQARRRGTHKWVYIGFSGDGLGHGIFNPSVFSPAPDQAHQGRMDFKGETVLGHVVFWFGLADKQVKTCRSAFSLLGLPGFGGGWPASPILDDDAPSGSAPHPEAALMPDPGPGEVPAAAVAPLPAFLEIVEPPPRRAPIPVTEASGQHFQDPAPAEPPKLYPPLPVSTDRKGKGDSRIKQRLCSAKDSEERALLQMPLREVQQPPVQGTDGHYRQHPP